MGRVAPNYYVQDSVIPRTRLAEVLGQIDELASEHDLQVANVFHAGDGNLHPLVCYDAGKPGEAERAEAGRADRQGVCRRRGSITGEHGVGVDKKRYMPSMFERTTSDVPAAALRLRSRPARQPRKGYPHVYLCGEVPVPTASTRSSRPAWRSASDGGGAGPLHPGTSSLACSPRRGRRAHPCASTAAGPSGLGGARGELLTDLPTSGLDRIIEHNAGDLTAVLEAGVTLAAAQAAFADAGQMLALDPPDNGATIGGIVATADSGPLRSRFGVYAIWWWGCEWRSPTARSPRAAAR